MALFRRFWKRHNCRVDSRWWQGQPGVQEAHSGVLGGMAVVSVLAIAVFWEVMTCHLTHATMGAGLSTASTLLSKS